MVKIFCVNTQTSMTFPEGTALIDMLPAFEFEKPYPILCAKVNNVSQGLKYRAFNSRKVEFLDYTSYIGRSVYCNSLCFLLCKAAKASSMGVTSTVAWEAPPIDSQYLCALS